MLNKMFELKFPYFCHTQYRHVGTKPSQGEV